MMGVLSYVVLVLLLCISIVHGIIDVTVHTSSGWVSGLNSTTHKIWYGVPYAASPAGQNRWKPPQPPTPWSGIRNTNFKRPYCPQAGRDASGMSEDCLYVNIYAPLLSTNTSSLPVYVWIHGGSFWQGSADGVSGEYFAGEDMIFVAVNYRLGTFGYLALPALQNESSLATTGFYGIQDQRAAFAWVQENIRAFGGDPKRVTIAGQSAGAISVCIHVAAARSAGHFAQALMESGECYIPDQATAVQQSQQVVKSLACEGADVLSCLRGKSIAQIINATAGPIWPSTNPYEMTKQPVDLIREGTYNQVPLLVGTNHDEQSFEACPWYGSTTVEQYPTNMQKVFGGTLTPSVLKMYPVQHYSPPVGGIVAAWSDSRFKCPTLEAVEAMSVQSPKINVYMYEFNHVPSWQKDACLNVTHSTELGFLYVSGSSFNEGTPQEKTLAKALREYWVSFIQDGEPVSATAGVKWAPFVNGTQPYLDIDVPSVSMQERFDAPYCDFWAAVQPH